METPLTLNNTRAVRELLIFLFSQNFILEVRALRLLYRKNDTEYSVKYCTIQNVRGNAKLFISKSEKSIHANILAGFCKTGHILYMNCPLCLGTHTVLGLG